MPRYYFDVTDAGQPCPDRTGIDLADDDEARDEAISLLPDLIHDVLRCDDQHEIAVSVRNEAGAVVYEASLTLDGRWWPGRR